MIGRRFFRSVGLTILAVGLACSAVASFAQDGAAIPPADEKGMTELLADFAILESQMAAKETEFNQTEDFRAKEELKQQFTDMVKRANEVIEKLRAAALVSLESESDRAQAARTLLGIMVNDASLGLDNRVLELGDQLIARKIDRRYFETASRLERLPLAGQEIFEELLVRYDESTADDLPRVKLETSKGDIVVELLENEAPKTVGNFVHLVEQGFFDGLAFHRVIDGFMAQTGNPASAGREVLDYTIPCESQLPEARKHFTGSVSMALPMNGRDQGTSEFFITFNRSVSVQALDRNHTVFGRVVSGMDVLQQLTRTHQTVGGQEYPIPNAEADKIVKATVVRKRDHEYLPTKVTPAGDAPAEGPAIEPPVGSDQSGGDGGTEADQSGGGQGSEGQDGGGGRN